MEVFVRRLLNKAPFLYPLFNWCARRRYARELVKWEAKGRPVPPPHLVKQRTLRTYLRTYGLTILVETGTLYGDMVEAMKNDFNRLYSIELSHSLYEAAKRRFKGERHVELVHGDSGVELMGLMYQIDEPALFWLDGHYSAGVTARGESDTPIYEELAHILTAPDRGHVIIIDDAHCFGSDPAYPTMEELRDFIESRRPNVRLSVQDDSIRITPEQ